MPAEHFRILRPLLACGPAAGRWPLGCRVVVWGLGPNDGISGSCGMPCGAVVLTAGHYWQTMGRVRGIRDLFQAVLKSGMDEINRNLAAICLPKMSPGVAAKAQKKAADLPPASIYCERRGRRPASQLESQR